MEAEVRGGVSVRVRRKVDRAIVITMPVGTAFVASGRASEMIARRDAAILLDEDGWQNWNVRAVRRERSKPVPSDGDVLVVPPPPHSLRALMQAIQVGTYTFEGRLTYPVRTVEIEQAALWIDDEDARYRDMADDIEGDRIPAEYAAAFAVRTSSPLARKVGSALDAGRGEEVHLAHELGHEAVRGFVVELVRASELLQSTLV